MSTIRLTTAQALIRYLTQQKVRINDEVVPLFAGVWAIFGHGNVAALGEALYSMRDQLPTYRGHNEQTMAHAAIAYANSLNRKRMMAVTSSIGPGATNMVTAAALAHVNRLPVLLLPGDTFANRRPDPVLQQVENFSDPTISANDVFKPVSRYWDRITRPEQLIGSLPRALSVLNDGADCGPATLCLCQDVQAEAYDYPIDFFDEKIWEQRRPRPDTHELRQAQEILLSAKKPLIIAGGGVHYSDAMSTLSDFALDAKIPVAETQAGKGALPWDHSQNVGSIGVTGSSAANSLAEDADVILVVGSRLQDFISGSRALFNNPNRKLILLNISAFDGQKHQALPLVCDAKEGLLALMEEMSSYTTPQYWQDLSKRLSH
ncbi:MAG: 3D-(3,5/4)-trihydroxycyclohexane-1,2-dione acylhydrolase (decyclizing), partial [Sneathiella sp.]|nr:3D-(3,5/4)-trihydroxycyclohexane-1,2-dione acylhydrolase (decyclizing) [Sneathiella sp.]